MVVVYTVGYFMNRGPSSPLRGEQNQRQ